MASKQNSKTRRYNRIFMERFWGKLPIGLRLSILSRNTQSSKERFYAFHTQCGICEEYVLKEEITGTCGTCQSNMCFECDDSVNCSHCGKTLCDECGEYCNGCDCVYCEDCRKYRLSCCESGYDSEFDD
jgi:hypothetical protein